MQTSSQKHVHILTFQTVSDISTEYLFCNDVLPFIYENELFTTLCLLFQSIVLLDCFCFVAAESTYTICLFPQ